ncbi:SDR family oxidoreductase [Saccharomonospora sp. NPDC046836]|uniref:SDR family NAD(P)-dependent oxidoreductase n=1 Tax=Saccharomonospora sp. NPDC046836 TaxID=3156921 RepID=UPI00340AF046
MTVERSARTALVTGASSGLGAEFAAQLAARGDDLVLVARSGDRLERLAARLRANHKVRVEVIVQDLAEQDAARRISTRLTAAGIGVDLLVNNAGFGSAGHFGEIDAESEREQLMVNVVALVGLTHALVPGMLAKGGGEIINVGSTAGFQPSPYFVTYSSGKAFVLNFSLALRAELGDRGVRVLALCPGPTETAFFDRVGKGAAIGGKTMAPAAVVRAALRGLERNRAYVVPGLGNALSAHLTPRRPRRMIAAMAKRVTRSVVAGDPRPKATLAATDG